MKRTDALERIRTVMKASRMRASYVTRMVEAGDRLLAPAPGGGDEVVAMTPNATPWAVPEGHEPVDYLITHLLEEAPRDAFSSDFDHAGRFAALKRVQHPAERPTPDRSAPTLEEMLNMVPGRETGTLEKALGVPVVRSEPDALQRRLGDHGV
jgi:hypothetical protein